MLLHCHPHWQHHHQHSSKPAAAARHLARPRAGRSGRCQRSKTSAASVPRSAPTNSATARRQLVPGLLPLLQGLRAVGSPQRLVGWQVVAAKHHRQQHAPVGTVTKVESIRAEGKGGPSYQLLRVELPTVLQPYGFEGCEVHLLPLVPEIITAVHPQQRLLVASPPEGLLDLGRRGLLLNFLSQELLPFAPASPHGSTAAGIMAGGRALTQARDMPTKAALLAAGRSDLVGLILKVGGFTQAALQLGMRASRRPSGYWDSLEVLDTELDAFIAGRWVALPCPDDEEGEDGSLYFYNTATATHIWQLPDELQALAVDPSTTTSSSSSGDSGGTGAAGGAVGVLSPSAYQALLDLQEERVMPSSSAVMEAGRWDLHKAITRHGGFKAVAAELDRRQFSGVRDELLTAQGVKHALKDVCLQEGWDVACLPTARQLVDIDRLDIFRAIRLMGGWRATAQALNLSSRNSTPQAWRDWSVDTLAQQLAHFMAEQQQEQQQLQQQQQQQQQPAPTTSTSGSSRARSSSSPGEQAGQQAQQRRGSRARSRSRSRSRARTSSLPPVSEQPPQLASQHLPTEDQLVAAGRLDLLYGIRRFGYEVLRLHMGLQPRYSRPKVKGSLKWPAVEAAVASGCHTCPDILRHISSDTTSCPLVSRAHLQRQLKAWVDEGRLVKPARNCYTLPPPADDPDTTQSCLVPRACARQTC